METILKERKILITGGAGFIGSHLCDHFLKNNSVRCLDNLKTGFYSNIEPFLASKNFEFIEGDITDFNCCQRAVKGMDIVFHQAALGSVPRSIENPIPTNKSNIDGFLNMIEATRLEGIKRFIYAASSSTYGDSKELPKKEERIGKPLSPYAVTKLVNELYAGVYSSLYGLETIGLRYFNVFGLKQSPQGEYAAVIPRFIEAIRTGKELIINGDGSQTRDFTFVDNVVIANERAALVKDEHSLNTVYNIACSEQISIRDLAGFMLDYFDKEYNLRGATITHTSKRIGDIQDSIASIDKAKKHLNYYPTVTVRDGLRRLMDSYF